MKINPLFNPTSLKNKLCALLDPGVFFLQKLRALSMGSVLQSLPACSSCLPVNKTNLIRLRESSVTRISRGDAQHTVKLSLKAFTPSFMQIFNIILTSE